MGRKARRGKSSRPPAMYKEPVVEFHTSPMARPKSKQATFKRMAPAPGPNGTAPGTPGVGFSASSTSRGMDELVRVGGSYVSPKRYEKGSTQPRRKRTSSKKAPLQTTWGDTKLRCPPATGSSLYATTSRKCDSNTHSNSNSNSNSNNKSGTFGSNRGGGDTASEKSSDSRIAVAQSRRWTMANGWRHRPRPFNAEQVASDVMQASEMHMQVHGDRSRTVSRGGLDYTIGLFEDSAAASYTGETFRGHDTRLDPRDWVEGPVRSLPGPPVMRTIQVSAGPVYDVEGKEQFQSEYARPNTSYSFGGEVRMPEEPFRSPGPVYRPLGHTVGMDPSKGTQYRRSIRLDPHSKAGRILTAGARGPPMYNTTKCLTNLSGRLPNGAGIRLGPRSAPQYEEERQEQLLASSQSRRHRDNIMDDRTLGSSASSSAALEALTIEQRNARSYAIMRESLGELTRSMPQFPDAIR